MNFRGLDLNLLVAAAKQGYFTPEMSNHHGVVVLVDGYHWRKRRRTGYREAGRFENRPISSCRVW